MSPPPLSDMTGDISARERALRRLPLPYSLALRLRDARVAAELISEYIGVDQSALAGVFRIGEAKLAAAQQLLIPINHSSRHEESARPRH